VVKRVVSLSMVFCVLAAVVSSAAPFQFFETGWCVALFHNAATETYGGLRVKFSGAVEPLQVFGIGTNLVLESNEGGVLVFKGPVPTFATWEIDWPLGGPTIVEAAWIRVDGTDVAINTHAPTARMAIQFPPEVSPGCPGGTLVPFFPIDVGFLGLGSSDPEGQPLARYAWTWSDGVGAEGYQVERRFDYPGFYSVTLTVWDVEGFSDSVSSEFLIPEQLCDR
jgi:hypothetical protein